MGGLIEIEPATRILVPQADGSSAVKLISNGRVRCSPDAAMNLRNGLVSALKLLEQPQPNRPQRPDGIGASNYLVRPLMFL
jgi:hypothetical protein